jgi:hypothetical protein
MNIRPLKLTALAIVFLVLVQGCSFYARLGTSRQPDLTNVAADTEGGAGISAPHRSQDQMAFTNGRDIR